MSEFDQWAKVLPTNPIVKRDEFIVGRCAGKSVSHLGACDSPMTRSKAKEGVLLHQGLRRVARSLVGYDHDGPAIQLLADDFGICDIVEIDLAAGDPRSLTRSEVVVCADIIEHVNNAGSLLGACSDLLDSNGELIVSTINALSIKQAIRALLRREPVHPDHVSYFSYGTLGKLLSRYDLEIVDFRTFEYPTVSRGIGSLFTLIYRFFPQSADGIILIARKCDRLPSATDPS